MKNRPQSSPHPSFVTGSRAGRVSPTMAVVLAALALATGVVVYLAAQRLGGTTDPTDKPPPRASAKQIEEQIAALQRAFQDAMQEKRDLGRIKARALDLARRYPEQTDGHVLLAQVRMRMQEWEAAYESLTRALADEPNAYELQKMAGVCAAKLGHLDKAERHYRAAIDAAGSGADSGMYNNLGQIYIVRGDARAAEQAFRSALKAPGPNGEQNYLHESRSGLADAAVLRGDFESAHNEIDRAIRLGNADSQADVAAYSIQKARIYMDQGRDDDAVTMLKYTGSTYPESMTRLESTRLRAKLYERAGHVDQAAEYVQTICELKRLDEKQDPRVLADFTALLTEWQIKAGQTDAARISLHNLETLAPEHPRLSELRGRLR